MQSILQNIQGQQEYKHDNGEISTVTVELAGMSVRRVRVANLPPEVKEPVLRDAMAQYGDVKDIQEEQWPNQYRYKVSNGIKIVELNLTNTLPSHMFIAGHRVVTTCEGQPPTCYNCNEQGHHCRMSLSEIVNPLLHVKYGRIVDSCGETWHIKTTTRRGRT